MTSNQYAPNFGGYIWRKRRAWHVSIPKANNGHTTKNQVVRATLTNQYNNAHKGMQNALNVANTDPGFGPLL